MVSIPYDVSSIPFTLLNFGAYEPIEDKLLLELVSDDSVVLDIGANAGWYTLNWQKNANNVQVFSFEAIPVIYENMVQNLILNGLPTNNAYNFALSNESGEKEFYFDTERCGASSMVNLRDTDCTRKVKCKVKKLDELVPSFGLDQIDFIKCDVEGAEKLVFEGGIETIRNYKPVIYAEMLRKWSAKFDYHPNDIIKLLAGIGYECYYFADGKLNLIETVTESTSATNFFFFDQEKHVDIIMRYSS